MGGPGPYTKQEYKKCGKMKLGVVEINVKFLDLKLKLEFFLK